MQHAWAALQHELRSALSMQIEERRRAALGRKQVPSILWALSSLGGSCNTAATALGVLYAARCMLQEERERDNRLLMANILRRTVI